MFAFVVLGLVSSVLCPNDWLGALNKCSAVAEIGDRLATLDMGRKEGATVLLSGRGGLDSI